MSILLYSGHIWKKLNFLTLKLHVKLTLSEGCEAYAIAKGASDAIRLKSIHFYNEQRSDSNGSALGRIRQYTTTKKSDSAAGALFSGTSGLALVVANQIEVASQAAIQLLKSAVEKINMGSSASVTPFSSIQKPTLSASLSNSFEIANEATFVNDKVSKAINTAAVVALRDAHLMAVGDFVGPMRPETQALVKNATTINPFKRISFESFAEKILERRGLAKIESPSGSFDIAVHQEYLERLNNAFASSTGQNATTNAVWTFAPIQPIVSPTLAIKSPSLAPAPI